MTVYNWGESPIGTWLINLNDTDLSSRSKEKGKNSISRMDEEDVLKQVLL